MTHLMLALLLAAGGTTTVRFANGASLNLEVASEPKELSDGLMGRKTLAPDSGMLFVYPGSARSTFYLIRYEWPVDIVWIDEHKMIVNMRENAQPCRLTTPNYQAECQAYDSIWQHRYALQLPAGTIKRLKLYAGDTVSLNVPSDTSGRKR